MHFARVEAGASIGMVHQTHREGIALMSEINTEESAEFSTCRLFEKPQDHQATQTGHCSLGGEDAPCNGNILYCDKLDTLREYVIQKIETRLPAR